LMGGQPLSNPLLHYGRMKDSNCRPQHAQWFAQVLEAKNCNTQIVDDMFRVLRSFFEDAKQSRNRERALSAAVLENVVLSTPVPTVRLVPVFTMDQMSGTTASRHRTSS